MSSGDFDPIISGSLSGTPEGIFSDPEGLRCCEDRICNCLGGSLEVIAVSTAGILQVMQEQLKGPCEKIEECIDEIIEALKERMEGPAVSCEECKSMAASGLRGTFEYALRCAGACVEETEVICSLSDPSSEGKRCQGCGMDPCCCVDGVCVPCPEEEHEELHHIAWCNAETGIIQVTKTDAPRLSSPWIQVGLTETEEAAVALAEANCAKRGFRVETEETKPVPIVSKAILNCNLDLYGTPTGLSSFANNVDFSISEGGVAQYFNTVGDLGVGGLTIENLGEIINSVFKATFEVQADYLIKVVPGVSAIVGCTDPAWTKLVYILANMGHMNKSIGLDLSEFVTQYKYAMHAMCRQKQLDPDKAIAAFMGNAIGAEQLDTHWAINGFCPDALAWYKHAARAKPTPLQLSVMRRRMIIDKPDYHKSMRELGYLESGVRDKLFEITEQVPTMTDIIRLMVRDADDEQIVKKFGLDTQFDRKYGKQLKEWARDQGVPDIVAKFQWRAHWQIPSPGQLFEFWHRLRDNPDFGGKEKMLEDIKEALIQQDILPFWHEHYLAVSFRPMFRRDIRRAFEIGSLTEKEVREAYIQLGHSDKVADQLTEFTKRLRDRRTAGHVAIKLWKSFAISRQEVEDRLRSDGIPDDTIRQVLDDSEQDFDKSVFSTSFAAGDITRQQFVNELTGVGVSVAGATKIANRVSLRIRSHPSLAGYKVGALTKVEALSKMTSDGMHTDVAGTRLDDIDREVEYSLLARCQLGIKNRFLSGEITKDEGIDEMQRRGTVESRAKELSAEWECEKSSIGRSIPTGKLCELLEQGSLGSIDFNDRLRRIGYTDDDASILTDNCLTAISERRAKLAQREAKSKMTEERRQARELAKANALLQRESAKMKRTREKAARVRKSRERQLISAAEKVHDSCECDLFEAIGAVRLGREHVIQTYGLTIDETLVILIKAAEAMDKGSLESYRIAVDAFANEATTINSDATGNGQAV